MRASRLLSLLILLQLRGRQSAEALAREFEVSVRTIYRDVEQLSAAGVPIFAERGRGGGFELLAGYTTRLTGLTRGEADAVGLLGAVQAAVELGLGDDAQSAHRKLLASLPADAGTGAQRVAARFHLDAQPWYGRRPPPPCLRLLAEAVWSDRQVALCYRSWKGEVVREVSPLGLVLKAGEWYLVAAVGGDVRTYRVGAIQSIAVLDRATVRPEGFRLASHWSDAVARFEARLRSRTARVRLSPAGWGLLHDQQPAVAAAAEAHATAPDDAGWREAEIAVEPDEQALRDLLRLGVEVEVLDPPALRRALAAAAARIAARHGTD